MPLCERHASSRTAPIGWQLVDRRTGARQMEIWSADDEGAPSLSFAAPTERPAARRPTDEVATPPPAATAEAPPAPAERPAAKRPTEPVPEPEPVAAKEEPAEAGFHWPKHGEDVDDDTDVEQDLAADSPLLSRAFRAAK